MPRVRLSFSALAVSSVLAVGCAADAPSAERINVEPYSTTLDASTPVQTSASFSLEDRLVESPVVLWFWAPGCGTCNSIAADVERASRAAAGRAQFVGVSWYGNEASYRAFAERHGLGFPSVADDDGVLFTRFGVPVQPAFAFIAQDGSSTTVSGPLSAAEIEQRVQELAG